VRAGACCCVAKKVEAHGLSPQHVRYWLVRSQMPLTAVLCTAKTHAADWQRWVKNCPAGQEQPRQVHPDKRTPIRERERLN
jgi:hypothetical protein